MTRCHHKLRLIALLALGASVFLAAAGCEEAPAGDYDYVVVGAGAGGGPLASRLAREGKRVLLLEAGEDVGGKLEVKVPALHPVSTEDPDAAWWYFVQHHEDPALDEQDSKHTPEGILYPRGTGVGGSTVVNAMVSVLPSRTDWDRLASSLGEGAFRAVHMDDMFDRVREWLPITQPDPTLAAHDRTVTDFLRAAATEVSGEDPATPEDTGALAIAASALTRLLGGNMNAALRAGETEGFYRLPVATENGERRGPREHILDTIEQGFPLTLQTRSFVTRVLWDESADVPTAIGVEYVRGRHLYKASLGTADEPGEPERAYAEAEVILSAGTFNSPQLLMLSGVGDGEQLRALGIKPVVDLPGVGRNLQDRYEAPVVTEVAWPLPILQDCRLGVIDEDDPCLQEWRDDRTGVYATNGFLASALVRSSADQPLADLQIFASPSDARGYYPGYSTDAVKRKDRFSWIILKGHTENRDGFVRLKSDDPFARPHIQMNVYDEDDPLADPDLLAMVEGVKRVRAFAARARDLHPEAGYQEVWPGAAVDTDEKIAQFVRRESWGHHACCTNPMGADVNEGAVLDERFRVHGTRGLRVVDASVFPDIPGTFIALPIFMMSERAADMLLEDAR